MKKIKQIIMKDLGWKLLSVFIAIALWFTVINIENPIENRNYITNLNFQNEDFIKEQGLVISNYDEIKNTTVTIKVRGERKALDRLSQYRNYIEANVDLKKIIPSLENNNLNSLYIEINLPNTVANNLEIMSKSPAFVPIKIEEIISIEKNIEPIINGNINDGYITSKPSISPEKITISGPRSIIETINSIKATVNIKNIKENLNITTNPIAYDKDGNVVNGVIFSENEVNISIGVNKIKRVPIKTNIQGNLSNGFIIDNIDYSPKYIDIIGTETEINNINEILLPITNINNKNSSFSIEYDIQNILPKGIKTKNKSQSKINVSVNIVPEIVKNIYIDNSKILVQGTTQNGLPPLFTIQDINISLKGSENDINNINENDIKGIIDISNLSEGTHILEIKFNIPNNVTIIGGNYNVEVKVPSSSIPSIELQNTTIKNTEGENNNNKEDKEKTDKIENSNDSEQNNNNEQNEVEQNINDLNNLEN